MMNSSSGLINQLNSLIKKYAMVSKSFSTARISDISGLPQHAAVKFFDAGASGQGHGHLELMPQDVDHVAHSIRAVHAQPVKNRAADEHGIRAQRQRLQDICPA